MAVFDFKNRTRCRLSGDITSSQTVLPVGPGGSEFLPSSSGVMMAVIRDALGHEVVKITAAAFGQITVERGQDGSSPRAFNLGAVVSARLTKSALGNGIQRGAMRQISYNPNEVTVPNYFGEKISEVGVDGCTHRIWQNVVAGSAQWRIVYGDMCKDLQNYREWDWPIIVVPWPKWEDPSDGCGWTSLLYDYVNDPSYGIYELYRACIAKKRSDSMGTIVDYSGNGNPLTKSDCANCLTGSISGEADAYFRLSTGDAGGYYWGSTTYGNMSTSGKIPGNTFFMTFRIVAEAVQDEGVGGFHEFGAFYLTTWHGGGCKLWSPDPQSPQFDFTIPGISNFNLLSIVVNDDASVHIRLNGSEVLSGVFDGLLNPMDTEMSGSFLSGYAFQYTTGNIVHFDFKDFLWFKTAFSGADMVIVENALMGIHGITA